MSSNFDLQWLNKTRQALRKAGIEDMMLKHLTGEIELSPSQIQVAITLLDRILPKLSHQTMEVKDERRDHRNMSRSELAQVWEQVINQLREETGITLQ